MIYTLIILYIWVAIMCYLMFRSDLKAQSNWTNGSRILIGLLSLLPIINLFALLNCLLYFLLDSDEINDWLHKEIK